MSKPGTGWQPDAVQELLLKACLSSPAECIPFWQEWESKCDIDTIDFGSMRLLPMLYLNLKKAGVQKDRLIRYRSVYRHHWYRNRIYLHKTGQILAELNKLGWSLFF